MKLQIKIFQKTRLHCDRRFGWSPESVLLSMKVFGILLLKSDWALWKNTIQSCQARSYDAHPPLNSDTMMLRYQY